MTCRQLSIETLDMFYATKTFQGYPRDVAEFVKRAALNKYRVRSVRLYLDKCFYFRIDVCSKLVEPERIASAMLRDLQKLSRRQKIQGLERVFVHLSSLMLQRATEESILATFKNRWQKRRKGGEIQDVEFVLHFESYFTYSVLDSLVSRRERSVS